MLHGDHVSGRLWSAVHTLLGILPVLSPLPALGRRPPGPVGQWWPGCLLWNAQSSVWRPLRLLYVDSTDRRTGLDDVHPLGTWAVCWWQALPSARRGSVCVDAVERSALFLGFSATAQKWHCHPSRLVMVGDTQEPVPGLAVCAFYSYLK